MEKSKFGKDFFKKDLEQRLKNKGFIEEYEKEGLRLEIALQIHKLRSDCKLS